MEWKLSFGRMLLFGLYDEDGILRFTGRDRESCFAYADLFDLPESKCSLVVIPEPNYGDLKSWKRSLPRLAVHSS